MKAVNIFLLCFLGAALLSAVLCDNTTGPDGCCFQFYPRRIMKDFIGSYYYTDHRCPKAAVVLVTKKNGRNICVDPNMVWVDRIMRHLDETDFK
ncbi:PREDICTED: C-C motif chemokine 4-like [Cyprinodon variegatus]|uniref:C-C motif chemokine n=1 Tax=Cyprinodon variegatus TaxID=28743 RepID=A0A3Q2E6I5_CYPVA|nr:PREDICTED: C-C motif chemokine 4-like [Cyprinodon variegatus]